MTTASCEIDALVQEQIERMTVDPGAIQASIQEGLVTLFGCATADDAYQLCAAIRRLPGVEAVENRMTVR